MASKSNKKSKKKQITRKKEDSINPQVEKIPPTEFDKVFEQKLAEQYRTFRNLKEHHVQTSKFIRVFLILLVVILIALLLLSFSS